MRTLLYILALITLLAAPARAAAPTLIGAHQDWKTFFFMDGKQKVCFMSSQPQKQEGNFKKRGEVFFFVTRWVDEGKDVVSVSSGYPFKPDSTVGVVIDGKEFFLFTQGEMAWTKGPEADVAIVGRMRKGKVMVVTGVSKRGTKTVDAYSLKGVAEAYRTMTNECKQQKGKS